MEREQFENIADRAFNNLPDKFKKVIENVGVIVEDYPDDEIVKRLKLTSRYQLLGLYQGVSMRGRGPFYGITPVAPDKISLYQKNIEAVCRNEQEIVEKIAEVLIHEIGHYFGMTEQEIREAGF